MHHSGRKYLGGAGFIAYYLLTEFMPGIDPLGPENKLVFALGPLTGVPLGGLRPPIQWAGITSDRGVAKSEGGGHWGAQLKRAGYDALIIEGKAKGPVYLSIDGAEASSETRVTSGDKIPNRLKRQSGVNSEIRE